MTRRLVLDTNVAAYAPLSDVLRLERFGLPVSVSDMAFSETWARSVREGRIGKLTTRFQRIAPVIDPTYPIAVGGGMALTQARWLAAVNPRRIPGDLVEYHAHARESWVRVLAADLPQEEWMAVGRWNNSFLDDTDTRHSKLVEPLRHKLRARAASRGESVEQLEESLRAIPAVQLRTFNILATREAYGADIGDRIDALARVLAWRALSDQPWARGAPNDGADYRLLLHLAEGALLVTNEKKLRKLVDASGSPQRAWVRSLEELDAGVPACDPWGDGAIEASRALCRRPPDGAWPLAAPPYGPAWNRSLLEAELEALVAEAELQEESSGAA